MHKLNLFYEQFKLFLGRFTKRPKKKGSPKLHIANKHKVNLAVLSGLAFILLVGLLGGIRAITLGNKVSTLEKTISKVKQDGKTSVTSSSEIDNRLQYYLSDFIYWYFTIPDDSDGQTEQAEKLNQFYGNEPDIQSQGQIKNSSRLDWSRLLTVKDNIATYEVHYKQTMKNGDKSEEKDLATAFSIPFSKTDKGYYVTGLPWFSSLTNNQAKVSSEDSEIKLNKSDNLSNSSKKKLDKFLKLFFTNYTTDQENLDLIASGLTIVNDATFKSLDFTYYKESKKGIIAYVQVTFDVAGTTHSENFTLTLSKKGNSYYVNHLEHNIPSDYAESK